MFDWLDGLPEWAFYAIIAGLGVVAFVVGVFVG